MNTAITSLAVIALLIALVSTFFGEKMGDRHVKMLDFLYKIVMAVAILMYILN